MSTGDKSVVLRTTSLADREGAVDEMKWKRFQPSDMLSIFWVALSPKLASFRAACAGRPGVEGMNELQHITWRINLQKWGDHLKQHVTLVRSIRASLNILSAYFARLLLTPV